MMESVLKLVAVSILVVVTTQSMTTTEQSICLSAHNKLRALHENTPPFTWDATLAADSQKWADHLASIGSLRHDMNSGNGENLFWSQSFRSSKTGDSIPKAVLSWYNEIKDYSFVTHRSTNGKAVGHFTQLVWNTSTKVGCGKKSIRKNGRIETFIVSRYSPRGNSIRKKWGESDNAATKRVYSMHVLPRKAGAVTPTLSELGRNGGTVPTAGPTANPPTNGPTKTTASTTSPTCINKRGDGYCNHILRCGNRYLCHGRYQNIFKNDCYKACRYC